MNEQKIVDFNRVAEAIGYLKENFKSQPQLKEVAREVHLSAFHLQRLFSDWAGVSPKKFLQYISVEHAKSVLNDKHSSLSEAAHETGLSGTSRLHDLFVKIEGMTPGEFKNGGNNLSINYSFAQSPFGNLIVAATPKGICHIAFIDDEAIAFSELQARFPNAKYQLSIDELQEKAIAVFTQKWTNLDEIKLHLKGSNFQLKVWESLLRIPLGRLSTYGSIAKRIQKPNASRAVGTAIGANPVAFLIPCHRVIRSTGIFGEYRWSAARKTAMIGWEAAKRE